MNGVLVRYRPTWRQVAGRGVWAGLLLAVVAVVGELMRFVGIRPRGTDVVLLPVAFVLGVLLSATFDRRRGVEAVDAGLRPAPGTPSYRFARWNQIVDVHTERHRNHTVVTVDLDTGSRWRLPVPYDGVRLARDPQFEEKLFTIRNLWETYRTWAPEPATPESTPER